MRRSLPILVVLLTTVSACGQAGDEGASPPPPSRTESADAPSADMSAGTGSGSEQATRAPNVSPTAAPGVAFNYRYAFRLPAERISAVQEQHARNCEQLGLARCRITGMRYRVVNDRDVEAMLAFKLEPSIARRFGQAGSQVVTQSEGMLVESEITGTDVGTTIRAAGRNIEEMTEELNRLETRLRQSGLSRDERSRLEFEAQQLRQSIRAQRANRDDQQESLATTPMVFQYGSGDLVPGFDTRPSLTRSAERAWDNFIEGIGVLFIIFVTLLPWALLVLLGWAIYRLLRRRLRPAAPSAASVGTPDAVAVS